MKEHVLDATGIPCPEPLLMVQQQFKELPAGDTLVVKVSSGCAVRGILHWACSHGIPAQTEELSPGSVWQITLMIRKEKPKVVHRRFYS